jgi:hypothetical protein
MQEPFAWGKNDCATFACDAVLAMTGTDLAEPLRGKYDSALLAARTMNAFVSDIEAKKSVADRKERPTDNLLESTAFAIAAIHGIRQVPVLRAQRGDVVLVKLENGLALAIVSLNGHEVIAPGATGLRRLPLRSALRAWRI